ncbi:MAG: hypothetical protein ROR55_18870 [Devosia sp.]
MGKPATFNTERFNRKDGYIVEDISDSVDDKGFAQYLRGLRSDPEAKIAIGLPRPIEAGDLYDLFIQLRQNPVPGGVKQVDVREVRDTVRFIEQRDGFRDTWVIDDETGGKVNGTKLDDVMFGEDGRDRMFGRAGNDFMDGGEANDTLFGGDGRDNLRGDDGNDKLLGGAQNDILRGGIGDDTLSGGQGADAFIFDKADFTGDSRTVITDYKAGQFDQIVDNSGQLKVIATGKIAIFGGKGTLLEHDKTGDYVFVKGARLDQKDIQDSYTKPPAGTGKDKGKNGEVEERPVIELSLESTVIFDDGNTKTEVFRVSVQNLSDEALTNIDDLRLKFRDAGKLDLVEGETFGATYADGVFDLSSGGEKVIGAGAKIEAFGFLVTNRPADVTVTTNDFRPIDFTPEGFDGPIKNEVGFRLSVRVLEEGDGSGAVEVFIRNVGDERLTDLENLEFRFTEKAVKDVTAVWGADYFDRTFAVEPWEGNTRPDLEPGKGTKLLGFSFTDRKGQDATIDPEDFRLTSNFDDLLS